MGKIKLEGIEVMVRIGLLEEEQFAPQDLSVSLELSYDFSTIRKSDEITDGIDYREIVGCVRQFSNVYDGARVACSESPCFHRQRFCRRSSIALPALYPGIPASVQRCICWCSAGAF